MVCILPDWDFILALLYTTIFVDTLGSCHASCVYKPPRSSRGWRTGNPEPQVGGGGGLARGRNLFFDLGKTMSDRGCCTIPRPNTPSPHVFDTLGPATLRLDTLTLHLGTFTPHLDTLMFWQHPHLCVSTCFDTHTHTLDICAHAHPQHTRMTPRHPHTCACTLCINSKSLFYLPYIRFLMQNPPNSHPGVRPHHRPCARFHPHPPPHPLHAHTLNTHARCDESVTLTLAPRVSESVTLTLAPRASFHSLTLAPTRPNLTLALRASISPSPLLCTCKCS
jgi:hypothetical protein